jgi:uncharacterized protein involved in exopolysaccharide biosynthesis
MGTVIIGIIFIRPTFMATAQILVKVPRINAYAQGADNQELFIRYDAEKHINTEIELLKSKTLANKIIEALGSIIIDNSSPVEETETADKWRLILSRAIVTGRRLVQNYLGSKEQLPPFKRALLVYAKNLNIDWIRESNLIEISFKHHNPDTAARVVNALVDFYLDHHLQIYQSPQSHEFFGEQAQILKKELEDAEKELRAYVKPHNVVSLPEEKSILLKQTADLRVALDQALSQKIETEKRIEQLQQQLALTPETIPQAEQQQYNPYLISTLEARLTELELKEQELHRKYLPENRFVQEVKEEIQIVRQKLKEQDGKRPTTNRYGPNPTYQRLKEDFFQNEANLIAVKAKIANMKNQHRNYQNRLEQLDEIEVKLNQLEQKVQVNRQNYQLYLNKFEEFRISEAMDSKKISNVSLAEPAEPPLKPVSPKKKLIFTIGLFLAGFGGFGLVFLLHFVDNSLETSEETEDYLGVPVLASIPKIKKFSLKAH